MKIAFTKEAKSILTIAEAPIARRIILDEKEDTTTATEYVAQAADLVCECNPDISAYFSDCGTVIQAKAEIARNPWGYDRFFDGSGHVEIYVSGIVQFPNGFLTVGAYLTDI